MSHVFSERLSLFSVYRTEACVAYAKQAYIRYKIEKNALDFYFISRGVRTKQESFEPFPSPTKGDIILMDALSYLYNIVFEDLFLHQSHGFRKGRGLLLSLCFMEVQSWGRVDRLMLSDIVKCFDSIDHGLLI